MWKDRLPVHGISEDGVRPQVQPSRTQALSDGSDVGVAGAGDDIDPLAYWRVVVKRRILIAAILVSTVVLALIWTALTTRIYRSTAVLQIDNEEQNVVQTGGKGAAMQGSSWDPQFLQTQYELLKSRALAERVAAELNLDARMLENVAQPSWFGWATRMFRRAPAPGSNEKIGVPLDPQATAAVIRQGLTVEPVRNSRLVRLNFDSPVPAFSAQVSNAIAEGFIASGLERRFGASTYAKTFLEDQLRLVKSRLERSERGLVQFAQRENLVTTVEGQSLAGQNLSGLNASLATAQEQRIRTQARWRQAQTTNGAGLPADMLADSIIRDLQGQRAVLRGQYQQKLQVFKPDYPEMQQLSGQMNELDRQISAELSNIRASVKAEYSAALSQEGLLESQLNLLRSRALEVDGRSIEYNILKREVDTNRQLYDGLLQRYKEVGVAGDVRLNNISIIDRAEVPSNPFKPSLGRNIVIGIVLGLLLGVLVAFLIEYLDDTLKTPDDVESRLGLAVVGIIPLLSKQLPAEAALDPRSPFSEAYRSLRTALQFSTGHGVPQILLVTSPGPGEGKSTTSLNLARNMAQMGKRVLLVDGDLRNPSLHKLLEMQPVSGLSNLLAGAAKFEQVLVQTKQENLSVILAGPLPPNPAELLSGEQLLSLLQSGKDGFDQVIIDAPPVMGLADAPILANAAATLLVIQSGKTRIGDAQTALKRLVAVRSHVLGALVTHYDANKAGYGYHYGGDYVYGDSSASSKR